jgi:transcriptional regulator with XRE-family HTH domain
MTQERLGEALGVTFQQVQKYEKGANRLSAGRLFRIANLLEVEVSYFFEGLPTGASKSRKRA